MAKINSTYISQTALAKEWHPTKNIPLTSEQITTGSTRKSWWICPKGHEYVSTPNGRNSHNKGCPYCSGNKTLAGFNDLKTTHPQYAKYWDASNKIKPTEFQANSNKEITWKCFDGKNHTFTEPSKQCIRRKKCPVCYNIKLIQGINDLYTQQKTLVDTYWDYTKNTIDPKNIIVNSGKKVWWNCDHKHSSEISIRDKIAGVNCKECFKKIFIKKEHLQFSKKVNHTYMSLYKINSLK